MAITNGRNLAELASLINSDGKISAEAFSAELTASIDPTMYDSASDVPFEDAVKGTQVFVPSEGLLIKLTDSDWYSIDGSAGAAAAPTGTQAQGTVSGYTSGGFAPPKVDTIDKFPFAADGNATDVGDLIGGRDTSTGQSSQASGYVSGGSSADVDLIQKFPFATDGNASEVGNLTGLRVSATGQSSAESGYVSGGRNPGYSPLPINNIDKFPFAADGNATDVGDLTQTRQGNAGQSSTESGYTSAGYARPSNSNVIDKFPFAADGNATDVGDLVETRTHVTGQSSDVSGYTSGGYTSSERNTIDKFSFATDGNATDVGDLTSSKRGGASQSSSTSGYMSGGGYGFSAEDTIFNVIEKFPFATDADATDVGDLTRARVWTAGQQV